MNQITDRLWLGDITDSTDEKAINENRIEAILSLLEPSQEDYFLKGVKWENIERVRIPLADGVPDQDGLIRRAIDVLNDWQDKGYNTLVHCAAGISRSATITIAIIMKRMKLSWDEAEQYVKEHRPIINPAAQLKISALRVLGEWPYDGSLGKPNNSNTPLA